MSLRSIIAQSILYLQQSDMPATVSVESTEAIISFVQ